ncbi:MSHA biogenesis protein MshJ [Marinobacter fonticola]|uniref:MSHA biogenesis protein MshJ n=1 Tax=Marinobacter fonticola TaxID=2603215 RepID=UPI0011E744F1|nr:MSHA biogenesis protein MshJ [Marinobacter fonticola]
MALNPRLQQAITWYDERPVRERGLILATLAVVLSLALWQWFIGPQLTGAALMEQQSRQLAQQQRQLVEERERLSRLAAEDPSAQLQARINRRQSELQQLNSQIDQATETLIAPQAMVSLLRAMLASQDKLELVRLELLPPEPIYGRKVDVAANDAEKPRPLLYAHNVELEVSGRYLDVLTYLKTLEDLDPRLGWEAFHYEVDPYPNGKARLRVRTLSLERAWLGV